jgi:hypothetical protein
VDVVKALIKHRADVNIVDKVPESVQLLQWKIFMDGL